MALQVSLENVTKRYRRGTEEVNVLSDFNLEITKGEFVAIMGPSGSGKTTALNLIGGIDRPNSGTITVCNERIDHLSNADLARWRANRIGFIFQFYNLMPSLSAERNIELPLLLFKLSGAERRARVDAALEIVGLKDRRKHRPNELSGGQQQRIAIARALVADPDLLICDEPTGDLDRHTADEILALMKTLNATQDKTIVMVTHDQKAADYASRQVHVDKGMVEMAR